MMCTAKIKVIRLLMQWQFNTLLLLFGSFLLVNTGSVSVMPHIFQLHNLP